MPQGECIFNVYAKQKQQQQHQQPKKSAQRDNMFIDTIDMGIA